MFGETASIKDIIALDVRQCEGCGLVQLAGIDPVSYYRRAITAAGLSPEMQEFRFNQFSAFRDAFKLHGKKVAEIGAATGLLTDLLAQAGMAAVGIEQGAPAKKLTPAGNPLLPGYPDGNQPLPTAPFDGFVCINFLEHAPDPGHFLKSIAAALPYGAPGLLEVPAFEMIIERNLSYDWVADHLSYFTQESLRLVAELSGFEVVSIERVWHSYDWAATLRRRTPHDFQPMRNDFDAAVASLKQLVRGAVDAGQRVAVWGGSHQALTLLTACQFGQDEVTAIIDSAPFKQNLVAPGCRLPVVPPAWLAGARISTVVVMAAGYSSEVARQLRETLRFAGEVHIFKGSFPSERVP